MKILEYGQVDSLDILHLNLLGTGLALTRERAAEILLEDPRSFPFLGLYGLVDNVVAGQVGVLRLPVVSIQGADEVGGVWAVSNHPAYTSQEIIYSLLEEAHSRMRQAGLSFSSLVTNRYRNTYHSFERAGYRSLFTKASVIASRTLLPARSKLRVEKADSDRLALADTLFTQIARNYLGFARRHIPFFPLLQRRQYPGVEALWLFWEDDEPVGYATTSDSTNVLRIATLLLSDQIDPVPAVVALLDEIAASYVQLAIDHPGYLPVFLEAGFRVVDKAGETFMVKALQESMTADDFRHLYGLDSDRFLISCLDVI